MKVLFLDVDGVLNMENRTGSHKTLNKKRLRLLSRIVNETQCEIVLSSTWRTDLYYYLRIKRYLRYRGLVIRDKTTHTIEFERPQRGYEIQHWLDKHDNVETYAIVDDKNQFLTCQLPYFVQTDPTQGLTTENVTQLINILSNNTIQKLKIKTLTEYIS